MIIDIFCVAAIGYGFFLGFSRGIIKTIFTIISVLFGIIVAIKFGPFVTDFLESVFNNNNPLMFVAGMLVAFLATMIVIRMIAKGIEGILESANINIINQLAGGVLLAGLFTGLYSFLVLFGDKAHLIEEDTKTDSITYEYLEQFPSYISVAGKKLKPAFKEFWDHSINFMDRLEDMEVERTESTRTYDIEEKKD